MRYCNGAARVAKPENAVRTSQPEEEAPAEAKYCEDKAREEAHERKISLKAQSLKLTLAVESAHKKEQMVAVAAAADEPNLVSKRRVPDERKQHRPRLASISLSESSKVNMPTA